MMKPFSVVIPARMQSSRLANKMVRDIGGTPLIIHTVKRAMASSASNVIVATDHNDIVDICKAHNVQVVLTSDKHKSGTDRLSEAVTALGMHDDEIVVNVQGDEPLLNPEIIDRLAKFIMYKKTDIATVGHPIHNIDEIFNPNVVKVVLDAKSDAMYFSRAPIPFYRDGYSNPTDIKSSTQITTLRHIGIYAYSVGFLKNYHNLQATLLEEAEALEQLRALYHGYKIAVLHSDIIPEAGVDTMDDLIRVRSAINYIT